jgi:hypothetical protein
MWLLMPHITSKKIFSGQQLRQEVERRVNQCFEDYLCPRRQGVDGEETDGVDDEDRDGVDDEGRDGVDEEDRDGVDEEDGNGVDDKERDGLRNVCLLTIQPPDTTSTLGIFY